MQIRSPMCLVKTTSGVPIVTLVDGEPTTTSLLIAEVFGKEHKHVLQYVEEVLKNLQRTSAEFSADVTGTRAEFSALVQTLIKIEEITVVTERGQGAEVASRAFVLNEAAFSLIALSFTGEKAFRFKVAYVTAFEKMRKELNCRMEADNFNARNDAIDSRDKLDYFVKKNALQIAERTIEFLYEKDDAKDEIIRDQRLLIEQLQRTIERNVTSDYKECKRLYVLKIKESLKEANTFKKRLKGSELAKDTLLLDQVDRIFAALEFLRYP